MNDDPLVTLKPYVDFRYQRTRRPSPYFIGALIVTAFTVMSIFIITAAFACSLQEPAETVCRNEFRQIVECP